MIVLCEIAEVSRSGYYKHLQALMLPSRDGGLARKIEAAQDAARYSYGAKRMAKFLSPPGGTPVNHKRVARIMGEHALNARVRLRLHPEYYYRQRREGLKQTDRILAPNVLDRNFSAEEPLKRLVTDMTYVGCREGWLHLSAVMDLFNLEIIGHRFGEEANASLAARTVKAVASRHAVKGALLHSDKGPAYRSFEYLGQLKALGISPSFSRAGNCWDNAQIESFFGHLKCELGYTPGTKRKPSRKDAKAEIRKWLMFYNRRRIQQRLGFLSPVKFRLQALVRAQKE